jgi:hypothetical protein
MGLWEPACVSPRQPRTKGGTPPILGGGATECQWLPHKISILWGGEIEYRWLPHKIPILGVWRDFMGGETAAWGAR